MKQWWVYELRAGDWLYIGQTSDPDGRLKTHHKQIRSRKKPNWWSQAIDQFPDPIDWTLSIVAGPYSSKELAVAEEEKLQRQSVDASGRLWDKFGCKHSVRTREILRDAQTGKTHTSETRAKMSDAHRGENSPMYGKPGTMTGKKHSDETKAKMRESAIAQRAREISEGHIRKRHTIESKNKMREAKLGKKASDEARQKMKEAWIRRKAKAAQG